MGTPPARTRIMRQMHGKGQTCIQAQMFVVDNIDEVCPFPGQPKTCMEQGIFKKHWSYKAILRFSGNKNFTIKDAHDVRVRGLGIKIIGLENRQDPASVKTDAHAGCFSKCADSERAHGHGEINLSRGFCCR